MELVCGVVAAGYLVGVRLTAEVAGGADRTTVDRAAPFVLAAVVLVLLLGMASRSLRRARATPAGTLTQGGAAGAAASPTGGQSARAVPATLSADGRRELARLVGVLAAAGLLAPRVPDPDDLVEAVADAGEPVTVDTVLVGVTEAGFWRPGFRAEDHLAALAFHDSHVEQDADTLRAQVADLARLAADRLDVALLGLELRPAGRAVHTRVGLVLAGEATTLDYRGHVKALSTVLHVAVARALHAATAASADPVRLAWHWTDQGVWLAALRHGLTVERLDEGLGPRDGTGPWTWVDADPPVEAGDQRSGG